MAGKICDGNNASLAEIRNSRAYCEGMAYRASGTGAGNPIINNPNVIDSEEWEAWNRGWTAANGAAGGNLDINDMGCCSVNIPVSV